MSSQHWKDKCLHADVFPRETDYSSHRTRQKHESLSFFALSLGVFISVTTSLIFVAVVANFTITYQSRDILLEVYDQMLNGTGRTQPQHLLTTTVATTKPTSAGDNMTYYTTFSTSETKESTRVESPTAFPSTSTISSSTNVTFTTTPPSSTVDYSKPTEAAKINPIIILNEKKLSLQYECFESCLEPYTITANLTISLSSISDNFIHLTLPVATREVKAAKKEIAHEALRWLFKEDLQRCDFEATGRPEECKVPGNASKRWKNCKALILGE